MSAANKSETTDFDVGARLREVRRAKGLSQRALAAQSGVTNGMISMAEQNTTSPSVASLKKILDGIPMTLAEFFSSESPEETQTFFPAEKLVELTPPRTGDEAGLISLRQVGNSATQSIQMLHEHYRPGADTGEESYSHEGEEAGIVISGTIEVTVNGESRTLRAGDAYLFNSRLPHRFRNPSDEDCEIVSACTPPSF